MRSSPIAERFAAKVEKTDGCWLWRGAVNARGYGHFKIKPRRQFTRRPEHLTLESQLHGAYLKMRGPDGSIVSPAIYKVCSRDQRPWEMPVRRADEATDSGVDVEVVILPFKILEQHYRERCAKRDGQWPKRAA